MVSLSLLYKLDVTQPEVILSDRPSFELKRVRVGQSGFVR